MIKIRNLCKQYDEGMVHALIDVSLDVAKGEVCSIMGPSGCGKSTLLNMIGALDGPTSGEISVKGRPISAYPIDTYRNRMTGFVFQLHNLIPNLTLAENVELPLMARKNIKPGQRYEMAMDLLTEFGLQHRASFLPVNVSGGERQRASIARGLINEPEILLADEPTGSVDSHTSTTIMDAIIRRSSQYGMTTLIVTHNPEIANRTPRVIRMHDARI